MTGRRSLTDVLAVLLWLVAVGAMGSGVALWLRAGAHSPPFIFFHTPFPMIAYAVTTAVQATAGLVLAIRRPSNSQGWLTLAFAIDAGIGGLIFGFLPWASQQGIASDTRAWAAWLNTWLTLPLATLISVWIGFFFPTGRLISPRWLIGIVVTAVGAAATAATLALSPGALVFYPGIVNPLTGPGNGLGPALFVSLAIFVAAAPLTGLALARRYAVADPVGRLQIRWFVTFSFGLEAMFVAFVAAIVLLPPDSALGEIILTLLFLAGALPAIALIFAIFRYRLYDIDTIISRAFVYGALTAILAGLYAASITLFERAFTSMTGGSDAAIVLTTLLLATSFTPVKLRLEHFVERRFGQPMGQPSAATLAVLNDPAFSAALDARISEALETGRAASPASRSKA